MMIEPDESNVLLAISSAQIIRNLSNTCLINKAHKLPYCKRNILLTMIVFWDKIYAEIIEYLVTNNKSPHDAWNVNKVCLDYLKDKKLANKTFCEFFFNFHTPLTYAFLRHLNKELSNGMLYKKKFEFVATEMAELMNLAYIELDGLNISCETFGGEPMCPSYNACGVNDCVEVDNVFFVMMNEEYQLEEGLFEEILDVALDYLSQATEKVIMIIDYKNLEGTTYTFGPKARERYNKCMEVVEQIYFYHCDGHMSFASENSDLCKFIIPDKESLNNVIEEWRERYEVF